jgi:radical SAM protein with 4Fe4S-binding SPASM domain
LGIDGEFLMNKHIIKCILWRLGMEQSIPNMSWRDFPTVIQIGTNNYCGYPYCGIYCSYCVPQYYIARKLDDYIEMPMLQIKWIFEQIKDKNVGLCRLFLNGDGGRESRLSEILALGKSINPKLNMDTFTCGVNPINKELLVDERLNGLSFTISAHTPELYLKVHRGNKFKEAIETLEWVLNNKHKEQSIEVHCVVTKDNIDSIKEWWDFFGQYPIMRVLSPLVCNCYAMPSQVLSVGYDSTKADALIAEITGGKRGFMFLCDRIPNNMPCNLWNVLAIEANGAILKCCTFYNWKQLNFGFIQDYIANGKTLKEAWQIRCNDQFNNKLCESCNMKAINWQKKLALGMK